MPQIAVQQPTNLMEMFSSPSPMLWDIARGQVDQQTQANQLNRMQAQQAMEFEKQKQPFELSQLGLQNQTTEAQLPGIRANSTMLSNKADIDTSTLEQQRKAKISELATQVTSNDLMQAENGIKQMMAHPDPKIRAQGQQLYAGIAEIQKEKLKQQAEMQRALAVGAQSGRNAKELMQMQIDAGRFKRNDKSSIALETRIDMETDPAKKQAMLIDAAMQAKQAGIDDAVEAYTARAQALDNAVKLQRQAQVKGGGVDAAAMANLPTQAAPSAMPEPAAPKGGQLSSPEDIKAAYKAGKISREQAKQMLTQHGYK